MCKIFLSDVFFQAIHAATDINMYRAVQTGPNTQLGGLKVGKIISEYQGSLKEEVTKPPIPDATNVTKSISVKDMYLLFIVIMRYNLSCLKTRKKFGLQEQVLE